MLTAKNDAVQQQVADIAALKSPYEGVSMRVDDAVRREALRPVDSARTTFVAVQAPAPATPAAPTPAARQIAIGGLTVRLDAGVTKENISANLIEIGGKPHLVAIDPKTNKPANFPIDANTSHIIAYKLADEVRLAIVDKPGPKGEKLVTDAKIAPGGKCTFSTVQTLADFKLKFEGDTTPEAVADLGIQVRPDLGRINVGKTTLAINPATAEVAIADGINAVTIKVTEKPGVGGATPKPTFFAVVKGSDKLIKADGPQPGGTLDDFSRANVEAVFNRGIALARDLPSTKDAKLTIGFRALDTDAGIRPSEYQYIYATDVEGVVHNLGSILPEKKSGKLLHSPEEIAAKIDAMVKKYVESTK